MKKTIKLFFLVSASVLSNVFYVQGQDCIELTNYRDSKLYQEYERAYMKYTINQKSKDNLLKLKNELLNDTRWATSDAGFTTGLIASNLKATCDLILDIIPFNPETGVVKLIGKPEYTTEIIYRLIDGGKKITDVINDGAEITATKMVLEDSNPLGKAVKAIWNLSQSIKEMTEMPKNRDELKNEIKRDLAMVNFQIDQYDSNMNKSFSTIKNIDNARLAIDNFIRTHCKPIGYTAWGDSKYVIFGVGNVCTYKIKINDLYFFISLNKSTGIVVQGLIKNQREEHTIKGYCVDAGVQYDMYNLRSGTIKDNKIIVYFDRAPSNLQKCYVNFDGKMIGQNITGKLTWKRYDQPPILNYTIMMDITSE